MTIPCGHFVTKCYFAISDVLGRTCYTKDFGKMNAGKKQQLGLDVSALKPGIYFVNIYSNEQKLIVR